MFPANWLEGEQCAMRARVTKVNKTKQKRDAHTNVIITFAPSNLFLLLRRGGGAGAAGEDRLLVCEPQEMNACNFNFLLTPLDL
jgi:hypothetical protein